MSNQILGLCRDCKFWEDERVFKCGKCTALSHKKLKMWAAEVCDCGVDREIFTEPDFGCIQWESNKVMIRVNPLKLAMVRDIVHALDERLVPASDLNDLARRIKQYGARYDPGRSMQEILEVVRDLAEILGLEVK